jgi:hypothetical protein
MIYLVPSILYSVFVYLGPTLQSRLTGQRGSNNYENTYDVD